jgi:hypothetical protein
MIKGVVNRSLTVELQVMEQAVDRQGHFDGFALRWTTRADLRPTRAPAHTGATVLPRFQFTDAPFDHERALRPA